MTAAEQKGPRPKRSFGLYALLLSVPLLVLLPLLLYSGALLYLTAQRANESAERELSASNQALSAVVEHEFDQVQALLKLVANSQVVRHDGIDREAADALLERLNRASPGLLSVAIVDRSGWVMAQYPPTARDRIIMRPHHAQAFAGGDLVVSDLDVDAQGRWPALSVDYPAWDRGELRWLITAEISAPHLARLMSGQVRARGALAVLLDRQNRIVARTQEMARFHGSLPSLETLQAIAAGQQGVARILTLDGNEYLWAWSQLPSTGWHLMVGSPSEDVDAALRGSIEKLALAGLLTLLLGVGATIWVARRIARSTDRMAAAAPALIRGEKATREPSGVRQLDALYDALREAGAQIAQAMTDRDRALDAERVARALADEDNRAKDEFIATLSHELRNPLSPIRAAAAVLKSPQADPARRESAIGVIERQSTAMARLLEDLLDISRISSGRIEIERQPVLLSEVMEAAIETARPLIEQRRHALEVRLPPRPVRLAADPLRLGQVFANLLTNAAKYTDPGGRIEVAAEVDEHEVRVRVRDNGIGLEPQALEQVFQKFAQVRGPLDRSQGGLGLGLSLVRGLVRLHGGWVRAHSEGLGKGSEFVVGLPLAQPHPIDQAPGGTASHQSKQPR